MSAFHPSSSDWLDLVRSKVASLRFGSLHITVHEGQVVQIDRVEKFRIDAPKKAASPDSSSTAP